MSAQALNQFIFIPRSALVASLLLHLCIPVGWLTLRGLSWLGIEVFPSRHVQDVYQEFVQVDLVGLPDVAIKDLEKLQPTLPVTEKPAAAPEPVAQPDTDLMALEMEKKAKAEKAKAEKAQKAKEEAERKQALKKIEEEMKREAALKSLSKEGEKGRKQIKGNVVSQGSSVVGTVGTSKDKYTALVMSKIKEKFYIMPSQRDRGLSNVVHLELFPTGRVRSKKLVKSSSDSLFDSAVMQAIEDAQPLPIPEDLSLIQGGITVRFRAEES